MMSTYSEMTEKWMEDPEFRAEYDALELNFQFYEEIIKAKKRAGICQAEIAERMNTSVPAVDRIETLGGKSGPSVNSLRRYAEALGCKLEIRLVPIGCQ